MQIAQRERTARSDRERELERDLCHLANISYRVGRKLTIEAGPKFTGDAEATKMISASYSKPYVV